MKAMVIESFGGADQLKFADISVPQPKDTEVLIAIQYAAVNPVDWKIREGMFKSNMPHEFPLILGWDASGIIESVGKNVRNFKEGDKVFAYCRKPTVKEGTYAEYITCDASHVAKMPSNINFAQAAAIPLAALTAWQALFDFAKIQKGQSALIHAGAGGVGGFAIQFAKYMNNTVFTTCSEANHAYVKTLGANHIIDYTKKNFVNEVERTIGQLDIVFDTVGGKTLRESVILVKPKGSLVSIVEQIGPDITKDADIHAGFVFVRPDGKQLEEIAKLIEQGKVLPPEIQEMNLKQAAEAQEKSKLGHTRGKIVLKVAQSE